MVHFLQRLIVVIAVLNTGLCSVLRAQTACSPTLAAELVTRLPLDEQSGTVAHNAAGPDYNGECASTYRWMPTQGVDGKGALSLSSSGALSIPLPANWQPSAFSVSWWMKPSERFDYGPVVGQSWGSFLFHASASGEIYVGTDIATRIYLQGEQVHLNVWQQFTFTFEQGTARLYKNGQPIAQAGGMSPVGAWHYLSLTGAGLYDEVCVYKRAVTNAEANALYACRVAPAVCAVQVSVTPAVAAIAATTRTSLHAATNVAGSALLFDGVAGEVEVHTPTAPLATVANSFTVEGWVWPTAAHEVDPQSNSGYGGTAGQRYLILPEYGGDISSGKAGMGLSVGTNGVSVYEHAEDYLPATLVWQGNLANQWTHIAVVYHGGRATLYLNGQSVYQGNQSTKALVQPSLRIGGGSLGHYQGRADELRTWNYARTAAQVAAAYAGTVSRTAPGLVACFRFDEAKGALTADAVHADWVGILHPGTSWTPAGTGPAIAAPSIEWAPAAGLSAGAGADVVATPSGTTTYTATATGPDGCGTARATADLTVQALPPSAPASDLDRNWTLERTYDAEGNGTANVLAESKQFTDGLGRATQAQARSRASAHVFASETIYDSNGQPVVQTLAAPINNQDFAYKEAFAAVRKVDADGVEQTKEFGRLNFEGSLASTPDAINVRTPGTLGYYYSTENQLEPLTPATDYPYSLTAPADGPLGGLKRAAGPGEAFRMGGGHEVKGREIPLLKEFDNYVTLRHHFVLGTNNQHSLQQQGTKSISVDGEGRERVVVTNKEGQALVSCLTGAEYAPIPVFAYISTNPTNAYDNSAPYFRDIHIPATGEHQLDFTVGGRVRIINLNGEPGVSLTTGGGYLDSVDVDVQASADGSVRTSAYLLPGFYRIISLPNADPAQQTQWFNYYAEYGNFSYTYYDDAGRAVAAVAPNGLSGNNLVKNPSFDLEVQPQAGAYWNTAQYWQTDGDASVVYTEDFGGAHSGTLHATHYGGAYYAFTHQLITNIPNGRYTLRAWVKGSGGQKKAYMLARNFGSGVMYNTIQPTVGGNSGAWTLLELTGIEVTNGQCDIGFESETDARGFIYFDDVVFARLPDEQQPGFVTRNTYDTSGRLLATESNDEGRSEYVYARDGRIRFSQSAVQRPGGRFSYSNYDEVGRVVESGEYTPTATQGVVFQSQLPQRTIYEAEDPIYASLTACDISSNYAGAHGAGSGQNGGYAQNMTVPPASGATHGSALEFLLTGIPAAGSYAVNLRYSAGFNSTRTMTVRVNGVKVQQVYFPPTGAWDVWDMVTVVLPLRATANVISIRYEAADNGAINLDYLEVLLDPQPTTTSVLNLLEDRSITGGLDVARCSQRNRVWYDEGFDASASSPEAALAGRTQEFTVGAVSKTQNDNVTSWYSYDEQGQVTWTVQDIAGIGVKTLDYTYDNAGNVQEVAYQQGQPDAFHHYYEYDQAQRLYRVYTSADGTNRTLQAKYFYYLHGPLKRVELADKLQGVDYTYTLQGWLKSINHVNERLDPGQDSPRANNVPKDLFGMTLDYFSGDYSSRAQATIAPAGLAATGSRPFRYDGTIRAASWRTPASPDRRQVVYDYDAKSQLAQSNFGTLAITGPATSSAYQFTPSLGYKEGGLSYDPNGNIQSLRRTNKVGGATDDFSYEYAPGTNRLSTVHGGGSLSGTAVMDYEYDAVGQMTRQRDEQGQRYYTYDVSGKTTGVYLDAAHTQAVVEFAYDDRGFRVSKKAYGTGASAGQTSTTYYVRDASGNPLSIYEQSPQTDNTVQRSEVPLYGTSRIGVLTHLDNGTAEGTDDARYELNDHLGDARVVFHRPTTVTTTASVELSQQASQEDSQWPGLAQARQYLGSLAHQGVTTPSEYAAHVSPPAVGGRMEGPHRTVAVEKGDTLTFSSWVGLDPVGIVGGGSSRLHMLPVLSPGAMPVPGKVGSESTTAASRPSWLSRVSAGLALVGWGGKSTAAQANHRQFGTHVWLRYRVFDEAGAVVTEHYEYQNDATPRSWSQVQTALRVQQAGTVEVAVGSDDSNWESYFDDLRLEQTGSLIVQEQHQYAYGSPLVGLNYAVGNKRYRYGYQGQYAEKDVETGFESFELRLYNNRIGRWMSYDPKEQFHSPYIGMGNNPASQVDPDGGAVPILSYIKAFLSSSNVLKVGNHVVGFMEHNFSSVAANLGKAAVKASPYLLQASVRASLTALRANNIGSSEGTNSRYPIGGLPTPWKLINLQEIAGTTYATNIYGYSELYFSNDPGIGYGAALVSFNHIGITVNNYGVRPSRRKMPIEQAQRDIARSIDTARGYTRTDFRHNPQISGEELSKLFLIHLQQGLNSYFRVRKARNTPFPGGGLTVLP